MPRTNTPFAVCLAVAAALRLTAVLLIPWHPSFDDAWYFNRAIDIAAGRGYSDLRGPTAYFPVGYPASLALVLRITGPSFRAAQLTNVVFSVGTMVVVYAIVRSLDGSRRSAFFSMAAFGFLPNQIVSCCVTMSEVAFTFVVSLGILLAVQHIWERVPLWGGLVGTVFGWATLIRPQAIALPFIIVPVIVYNRRASIAWGKRLLVNIAIVAAGLGAVVAPWTYRNYKVFGTFVLVSTNGGENLLIGNNPRSTQHYTAPQTFFPPGVDIWQLPELERDRIGASLAKAYIAAHPIQAVVRAPKKIWYMYRSDLGVTNWIWDAYGKTGTAAYYLAQGTTEGCYLAILAAGLAWIVTQFRARPTGPDANILLQVIVAVCVYFTLVTMVFFGDARYHQPLMPLLAIAAGSLIGQLGHPGEGVAPIRAPSNRLS
jgi:hypothetical protein